MRSAESVSDVISRTAAESASVSAARSCSMKLWPEGGGGEGEGVKFDFSAIRCLIANSIVKLTL